jgi:6-pyruvoyl-tetrahydropterin synthase
VILRGQIDKQTGMVYNIADLKNELGEVLGKEFIVFGDFEW